MEVKRGYIVLVDLDPTKGSEQGKTRPALVIQNDIGNKYSPTTIVAPLTSSYQKIYPMNVEVKSDDTNLQKDSVILLNQIVTVDIEARIIKKLGTLSKSKMKEVDKAIEVSLGLR
ncbi:MAG: type II toxin-antitoxin system PemK/MazF family toxin [Thermoplasmatota archaeon]